MKICLMEYGIWQKIREELNTSKSLLQVISWLL